MNSPARSRSGIVKKSILAGVLLPLLFISQGFSKNISVIIYSDEDYPPYSYLSGGRLVGIYPDILRTVCTRMDGYRVLIQPIMWKRGLKLMEKGSIFALASPYYRPAERPYIDYSEPIFEERTVALCRQDLMSKSRNIWPDDYLNLRIGINNGFASISPEDRKRLTVIESFGNRVNLLNLVMGRIDVYVNDELSMIWELGRLRSSGEYDGGIKQAKTVISAVLRSERAYVGFTKEQSGKYPYKADFVTKFNKALSDTKSSGEVETIVKRYIGERSGVK